MNFTWQGSMVSAVDLKSCPEMTLLSPRASPAWAMRVISSFPSPEPTPSVALPRQIMKIPRAISPSEKRTEPCG